MASVKNHCTKGCISEANKETSVKSPNSGEWQTNMEDDSGKIMPGPGSHFSQEPDSKVKMEKVKMVFKKSDTTDFNHNPVGPAYPHTNKISTLEEG